MGGENDFLVCKTPQYILNTDLNSLCLVVRSNVVEFPYLRMSFLNRHDTLSQAMASGLSVS